MSECCGTCEDWRRTKSHLGVCINSQYMSYNTPKSVTDEEGNFQPWINPNGSEHMCFYRCRRDDCKDTCGEYRERTDSPEKLIADMSEWMRILTGTLLSEEITGICHDDKHCSIEVRTSAYEQRARELGFVVGCAE